MVALLLLTGTELLHSASAPPAEPAAAGTT